MHRVLFNILRRRGLYVDSGAQLLGLVLNNIPSLQLSEFDKIYLPTHSRHTIHPYSDHAINVGEMLCLKLEEMIANKLKCLLQRRHVPDAYDLVYSTFINRDNAVNRNRDNAVNRQEVLSP